MLVLTRKLSESIRIGDDIVVTVVKLDRNGVRLGITAPPEIGISRPKAKASDKLPEGHPTTGEQASPLRRWRSRKQNDAV